MGVLLIVYWLYVFGNSNLWSHGNEGNYDSLCKLNGVTILPEPRKDPKICMARQTCFVRPRSYMTWHCTILIHSPTLDEKCLPHKKINWRHISRELKSIEGSIRVVTRQKEIKFLCKNAMGSSANKIAVKIPYIVTWVTNICFALCTLHICCFNCW